MLPSFMAAFTVTSFLALRTVRASMVRMKTTIVISAAPPTATMATIKNISFLIVVT